MLLYIYSKCSTCQKALQFLRSRNATFTLKDITNASPSIIELQKMLEYQNRNLKKLLNTSGLLYREMRFTEKLKEISEHEALTLLSQYGMLIKRPFLLAENFGLTGFNEIAWAQKFPLK